MMPVKINYVAFALVYLIMLPLHAQNVAIGIASKQLVSKTDKISGRLEITGNETQVHDWTHLKSSPKTIDPRIEALIEKVLKQKSLQSKIAKGGGDAGGGDDVGLDFQSFARAALDKVKQESNEVYKNLDTNNLTQILNRTQFFVVDDALDVSIVDLIQSSVAVNIPEAEMIFINRTKWTQIKNEDLKEGIALHELLSLARLEQTGFYPISSRYVAMRGLSNEVLEKNLKINSLTKTAAEIQGATPFEILKKLYESSIEPAQFKHFEIAKRRVDYADRVRPLSNMQCAAGSHLKVVRTDDDIMTVYSHTYERGTPAQGPLFPSPTQDKTRLILIPDRWVQNFNEYEIDEMALTIKAEASQTDLIMTETKDASTRFSFRYQNGLIAYKLSNYFGTVIETERYGYCWRK